MNKRTTHFGCALAAMVLLDIIVTIIGGKATTISMFEMILSSFVVAWLFDKEPA